MRSVYPTLGLYGTLWRTWACWRAVLLCWGADCGSSEFAFRAGVCVLAAGLLVGGAGGAVAVADPDSSNSAEPAHADTNASDHNSTGASNPAGAATDTARTATEAEKSPLGPGQQPPTGAEIPTTEPGGTHTTDEKKDSDVVTAVPDVVAPVTDVVAPPVPDVVAPVTDVIGRGIGSQHRCSAAGDRGCVGSVRNCHCSHHLPASRALPLAGNTSRFETPRGSAPSTFGATRQRDRASSQPGMAPLASIVANPMAVPSFLWRPSDRYPSRGAHRIPPGEGWFRGADSGHRALRPCVAVSRRPSGAVRRRGCPAVRRRPSGGIVRGAPRGVKRGISGPTD